MELICLHRTLDDNKLPSIIAGAFNGLSNLEYLYVNSFVFYFLTTSALNWSNVLLTVFWTDPSKAVWSLHWRHSLLLDWGSCYPCGWLTGCAVFCGSINLALFLQEFEWKQGQSHCILHILKSRLAWLPVRKLLIPVVGSFEMVWILEILAATAYLWSIQHWVDWTPLPPCITWCVTYCVNVCVVLCHS